MFSRLHVRLIVAFAVFGGISSSGLGDESKMLTPESIDLKATQSGDEWRKWESIANIEGMSPGRERLTSLVANDHDAWVGTSGGRLLTRHGGKWILQGQLKRIQITGIAVEGEHKVWLSTSDGIRRLERKAGQPWQVKEFRYYYWIASFLASRQLGRCQTAQTGR